MTRQPLQPVLTTHLFAEMHERLLHVLDSLSDEQWQAPTACEGWSVKDVALHILADQMGYLSRHRDHDGITFETSSWDELIALINESNDLWVRATRRLSRKLLLSLLADTGRQFNEYIASIDPMQGNHTVSWAGNQPAPMWLQIARECTEYWMHHQHICEAVGIRSLKERRYLHPVLSAFVYALPRTYGNIAAPLDTLLVFSVTGEAADSWHLIREEAGWRLYAGSDLSPASTVTLPEDTAWRLFTKGISPAEAQQQATITGNGQLGEKLFDTVSILV